MGELEDNLETLFLLEILVDNVQFDKPAKEEDLKETCVGFQFLRYPPLIICEEDFVYMGDDDFDKQNVQFKSGKSLLFALPSLQENDPNLGSVHVWITRRVARTDKTKIMGATDINLSGSFENLLQASAKMQAVSPISKFIRDTFQFKSEGSVVGTLTAFLRVSCFGKLIVTQFEVKGKEKFTFKGLDTEKDGEESDKKKGVEDRSQSPGTGPVDGMYPGGPGMTPGGPGMTPGGPGMYPGGPGMCPGGPGMYPGGPVGGPGQPSWNGPGAITGPCPGPKPWLHGKVGVLPCGEPKCPTGDCGHFPCSHAQLCVCAGQMPQIGCPVMGGMGPYPGMVGGFRGLVDSCPADRNTQVTDEEIAQTMKSSQEAIPPKDGKPTPTKAKGKGKKRKEKMIRLRRSTGLSWIHP
uniref:Translation initiation factor IF-2 n=1 Tax=Lygus hesperus TaxID=30085 RepID=A0A0A9WGD7_LYGHE